MPNLQVLKWTNSQKKKSVWKSSKGRNHFWLQSWHQFYPWEQNNMWSIWMAQRLSKIWRIIRNRNLDAIWFFQTFVDLNVHSKLYSLSLTKFHGTASLFSVVLLSAYVVQAVFLYILSSLSWRCLILGKSYCCSAHLSFSSCPANCCYTVYMG